jgi:putative membrane protein
VLADARWLEARMTWGRIVSHSRSIVRQASVWCTATGSEFDAEMQRLVGAVWAFPRCLTCYLRGEEDEVTLREDLTARLGEVCATVYIEAAAAHRPVIALRELTKVMDGLTIDEKRRVEMDKSVILMGDACEVCERIFSSPVPLVYTRHTARFLSSWLLLLPFALWSQFELSWNHVGLIPASAILAIFLFGIDELAVTLEEPFSILPLETLTGKSIDEVNQDIVRGGGGSEAE